MGTGDRIAVTGGTGFIGQHLVSELVRSGRRVRVLARGALPRALEHELVERHEIDLTRAAPAQLTAALDGVTDLIHAAGFVSRAASDGPKMMRLHVDGTRALLDAVASSGIRSVVLVSTSGTIAVSRTAEPILDERAPHPIEVVGSFPYYLSKIYEERLVLDWARRSQRRTVVVNPSLLLGPGDDRGSSTGDVLNLLRGKIPVVPKGGLSFVDARDAATATITALDRGQDGARYLLGAANWTFEDFFARVARLGKVEPPRLQLPTKLVARAASFLERAYELAGRTAPVDAASVEMADLFWYCDATKATRELGFTPRDPQETLDETVRDVRRRML